MRKKKESFSRKAFVVFNVIFMILLMVTMLFPYLNVLAKSLNDGADTAMGGITIFPRVFTWENFKTVVKDEAFPRAVLISVARTVLGTLSSLVVQFMTAYVFLQKDLKGRKGLLLFFMIPMYISGGIVPLYITLSKLNLLNNFWLYVISSIFSVYNMTIIRSYMEGLPGGLIEAARLDGASELTILARIVTPLSKPILATIALWNAVGHWNDWTTTMYFFTKKRLYTLQYILTQILKEAQKIQEMIKQAQLEGAILDTTNMKVTTESIRSAQIIITTIPIIMVYPFLQKHFIRGVLVGAVKD